MKRESDTTALQYILLIGWFVLGIFVILAFLFFRNMWNDIMGISLTSVLILFTLISTIRPLILLPKRRREAGGLILAARPLLTSIIFYFAFVIMFLFAGWLMLSSALNSPNNTYPLPLVTLFFIPTVVFFWGVKVFQQVEFRERGICSGATFVAWDEMESYTWIGKNSSTFSVRLKKPELLRNSHSWEVGKQYTAEVQRLLMDRLFFRGVQRAAFQKDN